MQENNCVRLLAYASGRHVGRDEILPSRGLASFRCWRDPIPPKDVADSLVRDAMAQVGQRACDPVIPPAGVFSCYPENRQTSVVLVINVVDITLAYNDVFGSALDDQLNKTLTLSRPGST